MAAGDGATGAGGTGAGTAEGGLWAPAGHGAEPPSYWWPDAEGHPPVGSGLAGPGGPGRSTVPAGRGAGGGNEKHPGPVRRGNGWEPRLRP